MGFHDKAVSVINGIQDDFFKAKALIEYCNFITQKNEAINVDHIILESFGLAENFERILSRNQFYLGIDLSFNTTIYERCYELINGKNYKKKFIEGISKKIKLSNELNYDVNPYLYKYNDQTQNLSNILFYQAKMACFFEENRNEEKLDGASHGRRITACVSHIPVHNVRPLLSYCQLEAGKHPFQEGLVALVWIIIGRCLSTV